MVWPDHPVAQHIDLHCHLLPGLDDGPTDLPACMEMLKVLLDLGFSEICATPHQRDGLYIPPVPTMRQAFNQVVALATNEHPTLRMRLGAENYWDEILIQRLRDHKVPCYDGGRAFLFEVHPLLLPPRLEEMLFELRLAGYLPVMAHPERYASVQRDPGFAETLGKQAALVVDLEALAGTIRRAETKTARRLVEMGLAHAAASDMHSLEDSANVADGMAWIRKNHGEAALTHLLTENPRRILEGELP